jgi:hypothetical protein
MERAMTKHNRLKFLKQISFLAFFLFAAMAGRAQTFIVSASPSSLTVYPGQTNVPVTVGVASGTYTGPVTVTLSGLPSGITLSPAALTLAPGTSGTIKLNVALNADQEAFLATNATNPNSILNAVMVVGAVGSVTATSTLNLTVSLSNPAYSPLASQINLPIMRINTNGVPVNSKTTDVPGTVTITSADGQTSYLPNSSDSDTTATFHVHGNSSAGMPKKAYEFKLGTSLDLLNTMGLKCPYVTGSGKATCDKSKTYVLLANYDDKTLLRDWTATTLANSIPYGGGYLNETPVPSPNTGVIPTPSGTTTLMPWASHSLFVELYLNDIYEGNYQLTEKVNVDSHRINITELSESDTTDDITGGYLMEMDQHQDEAFVFKTPKGLPIGLIDPDFTPDPEVPEQTSYISQYVDSAETALFSSNFTDPTLGWRAYYDEASAVNFYLVNDIMGNVDGGDFFSSDYLYKAIDNPFLYMGSVWDFDISSGNVNYTTIVNPTVPWMRSRSVWYHQWFMDPGFNADVIQQFNALKNNGVLSTWLASIRTQASTLEQSQANNFNRWPMLGIKVWPNPETAGSYDGEVSYLINYLNLRIAYLDSLFNGKAATVTSLTVPTSSLYSGSSATLVAQVTKGQSPTGVVSFFSGGTVIGTASLDGTGVATLVTNNLPLGSDEITAVYNGNSTSALSSSSAEGLNVLEPPASTVTSLENSASSVAPGSPVTLSVSVIGNSGSTLPSGSVTFTSNGSTIGVVPLTAAGTASYVTSTLPQGDNSILALYSGDSTHAVSTSSAVLVAVGTSIDNGGGFTEGSMALNGSAVLDGTTLEMTHGARQAGSAFNTTAVNTQSFTTDFTFQLPSPTSDGLMFVLQDQGLKALGADGANLGYGQRSFGIHESVGVKFDLYDNSGEGVDSTRLFTNGASPTTPSVDLTPSGVNLHSGNIFRVHMTYDGTTLTVTLTDTVTGTTATHSYTVNIPAIVGSNTAYAGFTAGEGVTDTTQNVLSWTFTPGTPDAYVANPVFSTPGGLYFAAQQVTLSDATEEASIYYTLDGSLPTAGSTLYNGPITIAANTTVNAIAVLDGVSSTLSSASYTLSSGSIGFGSGFTAGNLALNGSAVLNGAALQLTSDTYQAGSAYDLSAVNAQSFTTDFTFQLPNPTSDGLMFVLQNHGLTVLGANGKNLGYGYGVQQSVGVKFDLYDNSGEGVDSTGLFTNGAVPTTPSIDLTPSGVNLHSGNIFHAHMTYDGTTLTVTITDTVTGATATQNYTVDIPAVVGGNAVFAGFTAGEGSTATTQNVLTWTFSSTN